MKDITISASRIKKELYIFLILFIISYGANIYAIISYNTNWSELITTIGFVISISLFLYAVIGLIRLIINLIRRLIAR